MPTNNADNYASPIAVATGGLGVTSLSSSGGLVCAGTTSTGPVQAIPPCGGSTAFLTSRGSGALPNWRGSNLIFLNQQTASNSASLTFTSTYITSTYSTYLLVFSSIVAATAGHFLGLQISTNNGTGYVTTGYTAGINIFTYNSTTLSHTAETAECIYSQALTTTGIGMSGYAWLYNLQNGANFMTSGLTFMNNNSGVYTQCLCSGYNATASVNNVKLFMPSSNISSGTVSLFGLNGS